MNCMRAGRGLNRRLAAPLPGSSRATGSGLSPRDAGRRTALAGMRRRVSGPARQHSLWGATADACGFVLKAAARRRAAWMYGTCFMRRTRSCRTGALPLRAPSTAKWAARVTVCTFSEPAGSGGGPEPASARSDRDGALCGGARGRGDGADIAAHGQRAERN